MTNTIIAAVCLTLQTNWVTVENKQVGILVEVRSIKVEGKELELSRTIVDQKLLREVPPPAVYVFTNRWAWPYGYTNVDLTNFGFLKE